MFRLRKRLYALEEKFYLDGFAKEADRAHRELAIKRENRLVEQIADLTKALEWHVGTTLEILLAEERVLKLRIAENKRLVEETGSTALVNTEGVEQNGQRAKMD